MVRSSWTIRGSIRGNQPKSHDHFLFHPFGVPHLQLVLKVVVVDPLVLDDVAVLKKIMYNSSTTPSSNPVWESCVFPMREQQIFLAFFSVHPHLIKQIRATNTILDKTLTSTLFSVILLDRRKSSLLYLKKRFV